ncbi:tRNA lysidine(34) synthetase TilS [bacterium]|nr:tRNA lysidine(34) synthetase TilS [bacterium]
MISSTAKQLLRHLRSTALIPAGASCLIAVSGGGDSVALLSLLCELRSALNLKLFAAHLHHGLRPEADSDAKFVASLCQQLGVPLACERADTATFARTNGLSTEEAGRQLRYSLFRRALKQFGAKYLVTAHSASDQAETLLMRLINGTGLRGLGGIRPRRPFGDGFIVRPLLIFKGHELRDYLRQRQQPWCEDATNHVPSAPRTRVRLQLLPLLESWNPRIVESLSAFSAQARADEAILQRHTRRLLCAAQRQDGTITVPLQTLRRFPPALRHRAYRRWLGQSSQINSKHLAALDGLAQKGQSNAHLDLPDQTAADIVGGCLILGPSRTRQLQKQPQTQAQTLPLLPGRYEFPDYQIAAELALAPMSQRPSAERIYLNPAALSEPLRLRLRQPGDAFYPAGGTGRTKLKKYLNELKLSQEQRQRLPLIVHGDDIVWVVGYRADQRYLAKPQQQEVWQLTIHAIKRDNACQ